MGELGPAGLELSGSRCTWGVMFWSWFSGSSSSSFWLSCPVGVVPLESLKSPSSALWIISVSNRGMNGAASGGGLCLAVVSVFGCCL